MLGLMRNGNVRPPGYSKLDPHHWWNRADPSLRALIHAHPARGQSPIDAFEIIHACADFSFDPFRAVDVMKRDLERNLHDQSATKRIKRNAGAARLFRAAN